MHDVRPLHEDALMGVGMTYVAMSRKDDALKIHARLANLDGYVAQKLKQAIDEAK